MRDRFDRAGAITRLLMAIFNDLSRRTWWAYRSRSQVPPPRTTIVARRPMERHQHVPKVTPAWEPLVAQSLPARAVAAARSNAGDLRPVVWIDAADRPDITDLPRVLMSVQYDAEPPVVATQWLVDPAEKHIVLIVTFVEPVVCSWAISLAWPQARPLLEQVLAAADLVVALGEWHQRASDTNVLPVVAEPAQHESIWLPITSLVQLRAILDGLAVED